ncbi:MAG: hypothetical protein WC856_26585 [Methylococcaceae bacterium]|jgi:hypothetical protein
MVIQALAMVKSITRKRKCINPQIVRVSAMRLCIAQAAPESLDSAHRKVPASRPRPRSTSPASAAQSSSRCTSALPYPTLLSLRIHAVPVLASYPQAVCVPHDYLMSLMHLVVLYKGALVFGCRTDGIVRLRRFC